MKAAATQPSFESQPGKKDGPGPVSLSSRVTQAPLFPVGLIQRKAACSCGGDCPRCQEDSPAEIIQPKLRASSQPAGGDPSAIGSVLGSPGEPLEASTREFMEARFGHDFSAVRVHADPAASTSAIDVGAHAYTVGRHVVFGPGAYRPETNEGRRLIAHELTHTLQPQGGVLRRSAISDDIQAVFAATPTLDALLARLSRADVQAAQTDTDIDSTIATLLAARPDDLWLAQRIRMGRLGRTAGRRPVQAHFVEGTTARRALVIAGVHGSEVQGMEVARMLLADLATNQPVYTVILVPSLFPDNAVTRSREGATPTNRNFPPVTENLAAATTAGGGTPVDAFTRRGRRARAMLPENVMLLQLIERFSPERIISIHGTRHSGAGGVFYDPVTPTAAEIAQARRDAPGLAYMMVPIDRQETPEGPELLREAEEQAFHIILDRIRHRDRDPSLRAAAAIEAATSTITGRERRSMRREGERTLSTAERDRRRAHPSVPGNVGPSGNIDTAYWSGSSPEGVSHGDYASARGISIFTVEPPLNLESGDFPETTIESRVSREERRIELQAYADAIRTVLLGR
jgi:Domain of unknown function (DUF4157)/Succinylglutamate desuccinylase / Aspartoacylase family